MYLEAFRLNPERLRAALTDGGVGRYMAARTGMDGPGIVNTLPLSGEGARPTGYFLTVEEPGCLIVAKDRRTMLAGLLTLREQVVARGVGAVVAVAGSYSGPITGKSIGRAIADPIRQPVAGGIMLLKGYAPFRGGGTHIHRLRLIDRGFFVLLTGRTLVRQLPSGTRMAVANGYSIILSSFAREAVPPE